MWVALLGGTGGCTAGHRWVHCLAQVGRTGGWHCWALIISALMIAACSRQYFPHALTV
ncbi:unnamed protein product [Staurois parvus]|uniref:Uncharacterized protein n=1 Tax=Staurois parvus TaxID=386267 RepID=A0ABN9CWA7_9NEOB|nr:unnamed protein product [Staurois parvus]